MADPKEAVQQTALQLVVGASDLIILTGVHHVLPGSGRPLPGGVALQPLLSILAAVTVLGAGEAILGLLIEIVSIATLTQRFFAR